jgi:ubiquinone/menaquinone biosynthesis C-methylase UbiE
VLGHARLVNRMEGERPTVNREVLEAFAQLSESNFPDFIRYGLTQVTHGSIGDELAARMLERVPLDVGRSVWEMNLRDPESFELSTMMSRQTIDETERVRRLWDRAAPRFDKSMGFFEGVLFQGGREWVCSQAEGDVLEIAVGTGRNFSYYPADIRLTGIEISEEMLSLARPRAAELGREFDLRLGDAQSLDFPDASFDTVVCTFSLCSIPDDAKAVAEAHRVLRPGGRLLLIEHVRSPSRPVRAVQRLLDPLTVRFEGDHLLREPLDHLRSQAFEVERFEHSKWGIVERAAARKAPATS